MATPTSKEEDLIQVSLIAKDLLSIIDTIITAQGMDPPRDFLDESLGIRLQWEPELDSGDTSAVDLETKIESDYFKPLVEEL